MFRFKCPVCKTALQCPDDSQGRICACPRCQQRLQIPIKPERRGLLRRILGTSSATPSATAIPEGSTPTPPASGHPVPTTPVTANVPKGGEAFSQVQSDGEIPLSTTCYAVHNVPPRERLPNYDWARLWDILYQGHHPLPRMTLAAAPMLFPLMGFLTHLAPHFSSLPCSGWARRGQSRCLHSLAAASSRDIKLCLSDSRQVEPVRHGGLPLPAKVLAVGYIALALQEARCWFLNTFPSRYGRFHLIWSLNVGMPSSDYSDDAMTNA